MKATATSPPPVTVREVVYSAALGAAVAVILGITWGGSFLINPVSTLLP